MRLCLHCLHDKAREQGPNSEWLALCRELSQLTGRSSKRLSEGNLSGEDSDGGRRKASVSNPACFFFFKSSSMEEIWLLVKMGVGLK